MSVNIEIKLDQQNGVYVPGSVITGHTRICCTKPVSCKGIYLKHHGYSFVKWTESRGRRTETYISKEDYYKDENQIWGSPNSTLTEGEHIVQFSYTLPNEIPSSYESYFGHIRHECKIKIDSGSMLKFDHKKTIYITVIDLIDLNQEASAMNEISQEASKNLGLLWWKSGEISFRLNLCKAGYVPGEDILINAQCNNRSERKINMSKAVLYKVTTYVARRRTKTKKNKIDTVSRPEIPSKREDNWVNVPLSIPSTIHSGPRHCKNINIAYILEFSLEPAGLSTSLTVKIPILIGIIPHISTFQNFRRDETESFHKSYDDPTALKIMQLYPDMPIPIFISNSTETDQDKQRDTPSKKWAPYTITYK